jgi:hypothetical protein
MVQGIWTEGLAWTVAFDEEACCQASVKDRGIFQSLEVFPIRIIAGDVRSIRRLKGKPALPVKASCERSKPEALQKWTL